MEIFAEIEKQGQVSYCYYELEDAFAEKIPAKGVTACRFDANGNMPLRYISLSSLDNKKKEVTIYLQGYASNLKESPMTINMRSSARKHEIGGTTGEEGAVPNYVEISGRLYNKIGVKVQNQYKATRKVRLKAIIGLWRRMDPLYVAKWIEAWNEYYPSETFRVGIQQKLEKKLKK